MQELRSLRDPASREELSKRLFSQPDQFLSEAVVGTRSKVKLRGSQGLSHGSMGLLLSKRILANLPCQKPDVSDVEERFQAE